MPERVTLEHVAEAARVAPSTVSKVVNNRPNVSPATRERVEAAIKELGYEPPAGPRASPGRAEVALVFATVTNAYSTQVLDGILAAAVGQDVDVVISTTDSTTRGPAALSPEWINDQAAHGRVGVILVTVELSASQSTLLSSRGLPVVHIDPLNPIEDDLVSVGSTNYAGGVQATQHLIDLGHRRIGFAGGLKESVPARERMQGYLATLDAAGITPDPRWVLEHRLTATAGIEMGTALLELAEPPTAVFAANDMTAMGIIEAARRKGLRVPADLSVVGFDDTYLAPVMSPPLSTVRQPVADMGRVALRTLLQLARGERPDSRHIQLMTELIVRDSTTTAPQAPR